MSSGKSMKKKNATHSEEHAALSNLNLRSIINHLHGQLIKGISKVYKIVFPSKRRYPNTKSNRDFYTKSYRDFYTKSYRDLLC